MLRIQDVKLAVVGLGYVGLPLAVEFGKKRPVIGFDINTRRIDALKAGHDHTLEVSDAELAEASQLSYTAERAELGEANVFIVTVPTPIDEYKQPDLTPLVKASETIGAVLKRGDIVIYESTVYPGATEEDCVPVLERVSGLKYNVDFFAGYSPERINPGDREHPLEKIVKIVSGQDEQSLEVIAGVYEQIIDAGVHRASSIKVAEAAKVLENTQRDINIALMNEMSKICDLVGIRTSEVLAAAGTKWNFLKFTPGLVGGHCIGVDPYYLTSKAQELGYHPEVILSGRRINDGMAAHVASRLVQQLARNGRLNATTRVGILGMTFKENVPDIRNSKIVDLYHALGQYGITPVACDPMVDPEQMEHEYGIKLVDRGDFRDMDVLILAVPHRETMETIWEDLPQLVKNGGMVCDLKSVLDAKRLPADLLYWTL